MRQQNAGRHRTTTGRHRHAGHPHRPRAARRPTRGLTRGLTRRRTVPLAAGLLLAGGGLFAPSASAAPGCDAQAPGAPSGSPTRGSVTYDGSNLTVSNVVFDASHSDDLVRVYNGHVVFDHVTFRGTGTGGSGHTLEVKRGGSVEVYNSVFADKPSEDTVQFHEHEGTSTLACSDFRTSPGEDHLDFKPSDGAVVNVRDNTFDAGTPGGRTVQNAGSGGVQNFSGNTGMGNVFYEEGATGTLEDNKIDQLDLYDVSGVKVTGNSIGGVKHGEGSGDRDPVNVAYVNNAIGTFAFNGGSCSASGNTGASLSPCSAAAAQPASTPTATATSTPTPTPTRTSTPTPAADPTPTPEVTEEPAPTQEATAEPAPTEEATDEASPSEGSCGGSPAVTEHRSHGHGHHHGRWRD